MLIFLPALLSALGTHEQACDASSFSRDLGNTHCPSLAKNQKANSTDECMQACCAAGDACQTWQWCEAGKACAQGFWAQHGALSAGSDIDGWPKSSTITAAEEVCASNAECIGITYHSAELHPSNTSVLKVYLKHAGPSPRLRGLATSRRPQAASSERSRSPAPTRATDGARARCRRGSPAHATSCRRHKRRASRRTASRAPCTKVSLARSTA